MAEYRTIRMTFWTDPYIEELEPKAKLLYIYLFTNPHTNNLGVMETSHRKIAFETGIDVAEVKALLERFEAEGKVVCDLDAHQIFVTRFVRHQCSTSEKLLVGLKALAKSITSAKIAKAVRLLYPQVCDDQGQEGDMVSTQNTTQEYGTDTLSTPYADSTDTLSIPSGEIGNRKLELGSNNTPLRGVVDNVPVADASLAETASEETAVEAQKPTGPPPCPHQQIIDAYHELLPELPRIRSWTNTRSKHLAARWKERLAAGKYETAAEGIAYWRRLFEYIHGQCPWLMGQRTGRDGRAFYASLGWLVQPENFAKVIEGKYVEREGGEA